jgi:hypothetical protein
MDRVIGIEYRRSWTGDARVRAERLSDRRAAAARCERAGLLRRCRPVDPGREARPTT